MKNIPLTLFILFTSNFILYAQCESTDLIKDPSFEIDAMHIGSDGECVSTQDYSCVWQRNDGGVITNTMAYDGEYSWVTNAGSATQDSIDLSPNTDYILSCWINTSYSDEYSISIGTFGIISGVGPTEGWEKISLPFTTAEENLSDVRLALACHVGETYFDLFELCAFPPLSVEEETLLSDISIYPNPSKGLTNIDLTHLERHKKVNIKVFNPMGQLVIQAIDIKQEFFQFYLNDAPGVYFIEINSGHKRKYFKLIKE